MPTRAEALAILTGTPATYRAAVALGFAGLRVGDVLGLTADRIVTRQAAGHDRPAVAALSPAEAVLTTPKAEKVRTITVPALVAVELRRQLRDHVDEGILFRGLRGRADGATGPVLQLGLAAGLAGRGAR